MKNLLILGAGQYGYVAREIADYMGCFYKIDFLDDKNEIAIGKLLDYSKFVSEYNCAFVAIGNSDMRLELLKRLEDAGYSIATLISPRAYVSNSSHIEIGCAVEPLAVINPYAEVSVGCIISAGAVVNHNAKIDEGCHIDCNAVVAARAVVPKGTKVKSCMVFER